MKRNSKFTNQPQNQVQHIQPQTENQARLLSALRQYQLVIGKGSAGTGKSFCTVNEALNQLLSGSVRSIVLSRPNLPTGRSLGMFPGTIKDKIEPWLAPMLSIIRKRMGEGWYETALKNGKLQLQPLETIRGASFDSSFIIVDEAQNLTVEELKAITTRLGEGSRLALLGDPAQRDSKEDGLNFLAELFVLRQFPVPVITFTSSDVVRSDLVGKLVKFYEREKI